MNAFKSSAAHVVPWGEGACPKAGKPVSFCWWQDGGRSETKAQRSPGFNAPEPARDAGHGLVEHRPPADGVYAMARGHRTIFRSPHKL
jgi:hypothetical protein